MCGEQKLAGDPAVRDFISSGKIINLAFLHAQQICHFLGGEILGLLAHLALSRGFRAPMILQNARHGKGVPCLFVERAVNGELIELRLGRLDRAVSLAHARLCQFAGDGEQRVGVVIIAKRGHLHDFVTSHGQGRVL